MDQDREELLEEASLHYSTDASPGIQRCRRGKGFAYLNPKGSPVKDAAVLDRIASLVIPPAWTDVWICPDRNGYLQATGRDQKRRKQAIYHPRWTELRQSTKYQNMAEFGRLLPKIRAAVEKDLRRKGLTKRRVAATIVKLLETTLIRIGNRRYAEENGSYGLTTLRNRHAVVRPNFVEFKFKGKSGQSHQIRLSDRRLAKIVRQCQELPGQSLLTYLDDSGEPAAMDSRDVNAYLTEIAEPWVTAKHFRTWSATVEAIRLIREERPTSQRALTSIVKEVAKRLGHTPTVCRTYYIHPLVLSGYQDGDWVEGALPRIRKSFWSPEEELALRIITSS
jgi:DNA topoisomerase I